MSLPSKDRPQQILEGTPMDKDGWYRCERLTKIQAEMLLDWLEAHGYSQREVSHETDQGFTVRWRA